MQWIWFRYLNKHASLKKKTIQNMLIDINKSQYKLDCSSQNAPETRLLFPQFPIV